MAYEFVPLSADTEEEDKPYSFVSLESIQAKSNEPVRRRDVTPFKVDIQQPRQAAAPQQVSAEYSPSGDDFGSAIMSAAAPTNPNAPGLISRIGSFLRPEPKSVLENYQPSVEERQAEIDKRLAAGAGPISKQTLATADLVRSTRGTSQAVASKDATVNRVVQLLDEKKAPEELANLFERANDPAVARGAQQQKADEFRTAGEWAVDTFSALGQGVTSLVQLPTNLIAPGSNLGGILRDTQKELQAQESDVLKAQRAELSDRVKNEDGFLGKYFATVESLVTNPALGLSEAAKQVPNFLAVLRLAQLGGAVAGGSVVAASRVSPVVALSEAISGGAIQAGARTAGTLAGGFTANAVMTSGDAAGNVYETLTDPKKTPTSDWERNPDYQKLLVENLVKRGRTEEQAKGEIAKVQELSKDMDAMGNLKNLPGYKDYKIAQKEAIDEIATSKARLAGLIVLPLAAFGFMGAEATLVARGAGRGLAEAATPKGAAKVFAKEFFGEQIEEGGTQAGGNLLIQTVNPKQALLEGVPEAMATAAVTSAPFSAAAVGQQVRDALNRPAPAVDLAADAYARRVLDVQSYDANIIRPDQTAKVQRDQTNLQTSTTADAAAAAADSLSGSLNELLVPSTAITPLPLEPTLDVGQMTPSVGRAEPTLDLGIPATIGQVVEPTLEINPTTEQQFGLDKLRINAPRPQSIQGTPVADLTDDQLQAITGDESVAPISRRSAAIELTARQDEAGAFTQSAAPQQTGTPSSVSFTRTMTPEELGAMPIRDRRALASQFDQTENEDGTITFTTKPGVASSTQVVSIPPLPGTEQTLGTTPVRDVGNQPVLDNETVRADAQRSLDRWAVDNNQAIPAKLNPAPDAETRAVGTIANLLGSQFGTRVIAFHDTQPRAVQGVAVGGTAFVNTANVVTDVSKVSLHELKHTIEQIAFTERQAGLTNTSAQKFTAQIESIFDDITEEGKRAYITNFLHADELAALDSTPDIKESRIQEILQSPVLRSEMTADFMGNRATDKAFWADVAQADPGGFKGFVQKWVSVIDNLMATLRGKPTQGETESAKVDQYVRDLGKAKMVAREALIAYRQGTLQQFESAPAASLRQGEINAPTIGTQGSENLPGPTAQDRPGFSEDGGGPTPTYGTARAGAISVVGRHYSTTPRQTLSGAYYGQGLKGAERTRLDSSTDPRLKNRVYFYVDQGAGIRPESGVGGYAHEAKLDNIYDPQTRLIKPQADANAFESAVINAGFDGYIAPFGNGQSAVVLLGQKHKAVPVKQIGQPQAAALPAEAAPTTLKKGLLTREASQVDTGNIPGSRMRMGTLEIPAGQVEAANAELARIGSAVQFSAKQKTVAKGRIRRTVEELVTAADSQSSWRTWYTRHEKTIADMFGEDAALFQKLLSATSQATGVKGNVTLALKAYDQLRAGQPFTGYLPAVIKNLDRIANDEKLAGAKISQYGQANEGDVDAIAVDRHIAMLFFNTKTPNPRQIASAKKRIKAIAARLEWEPRQVQAALWAFNQIRLGTDPAKVESYDKILEARADAIATLRAQYGRGAGGGVQAGGAVGAGNQKRQGPVPVAKTGTELELNGVKFSAKQRDLTDIPTITFRDLVGKKVMGIKADLTTAGVSYTGIDGSQLEFPVEMLGGPNFVRLPENTKTNVVWAVRGGATLSKIMAKVNESDYVLVHAMNDNSHLTNATVSQAYIQTVEAYLRDKRITPANLLALDKIVQSSENKNSLPDFPGFESPGILGYIDGLSFDQRGALAKMLETKQAQALGLPNLDRFRRETMDAEYAGYRQGDTMLVIEIDKKNPTVKLGEEGTKMHPSYPLGLRGRVVGKLAKGVNYELIFRDYFENKVPTIGNKEAGAWYAFDRVLPVQEITSEIADALGEGGYENITSSRQAQASLALANNQWLESGKTKATGGISNTEFVDALRANEGVAALTLYDADEVKAGVKDGSFKIYQLGKEGGNKGIQIFFGLKRGKPWYADMIDGIKDNEVEVVSVINNEPGAPGVAIPAIITKAIAEGATVLDAFAVKSARFPDGFLPEMYGQFGFETIGTIPFDASYYDANKLSDLKAFWAKGGWKEADGYPDVVVMRWKGNNADRQSAIERYVRTGETRVSGDVPRYTRDATGEPGEQRNPPRGGEGRTRGGDNGQAGGDQGASNAAPVVRRAYGSLQELANLSAGDIRNLGLNPEDVARLRNQLAPGATPDSEAIFAGLEKRGLAKSKAETALANHPDGAQIKYVQENFNDILIQLEDADKVKINCK